MTNWRKLVAGTALAIILLLPSLLFARHRYELVSFTPADVPRVSKEKSGTLPTSDGLRLKMDADLGDVRIFTDASRQVWYRIQVEADARDPDAQSLLQEFSVAAKPISTGVALSGQAPQRNWRGRIWVTYEVHVPRHYNIDVNTRDGDISVQDVDGRVALVTAGGNITAGRVGATGNDAARLDTQGGHITIGDVAGDLRATTAGGHIATGNVNGKAVLRTGGGYIRTGRISGSAVLDTGGGNIRVERAGSDVTASTAGGQIDFGVAAGAIHARTGGGAVRIERTSGSAAVDASDGSVFLRQVDGPVRVSSPAGGITAWFDGTSNQPPGTERVSKMRGASQLVSGEGDLIVYLPRELAVTIDASVEQGSGEHRIVADPSLQLRVNYPDSGAAAGATHCQAKLNGGGEVLSLKAASGNIYLRSADADPRLGALMLPPGLLVSPGAPSGPILNASENDANDDFAAAQGFIDEIRRRIEASWWGGISVDSDEMQKRLQHSVAPVYPDVARQAGVEGDVILRVYVSADGHIASVKAIAGPPILARAAMEAVQQWQYRPIRVDGHPAEVVTTLTIAFRLR